MINPSSSNLIGIFGPLFRFRLLYVYKLPLSFLGPFSPIPEKPFPTYSTRPHQPTNPREGSKEGRVEDQRNNKGGGDLGDGADRVRNPEICLWYYVSFRKLALDV